MSFSCDHPLPCARRRARSGGRCRPMRQRASHAGFWCSGWRCAARARGLASRGLGRRLGAAELGDDAGRRAGGRRRRGVLTRRPRCRPAGPLEALFRAQQPLFAPAGEGLAALPQRQRALESGGALFELGHDADELVARRFVRQVGERWRRGRCGGVTRLAHGRHSTNGPRGPARSAWLWSAPSLVAATAPATSLTMRGVPAGASATSRSTAPEQLSRSRSRGEGADRGEGPQLRREPPRSALGPLDGAVQQLFAAGRRSA